MEGGAGAVVADVHDDGAAPNARERVTRSPERTALVAVAAAGAALAYVVAPAREAVIAASFVLAMAVVVRSWVAHAALRPALTSLLVGNLFGVLGTVAFYLRDGHVIGGLDPGPGDACFVVAYALCVDAVLAFGRVNRRGFTRMVLFDAVIVALSGATLVWALWFEPAARALHLARTTRLCLMLYPFFDLVVFGVALSLVTMARRRPASIYALVVFAVFSFVADMGVLGERLARRGASALTAVAQVVAYGAVVFTMWHRSIRELTELDLVPRRSGELRVLLLGVAAVAPSVAGLSGAVDRELGLAASVALTALLALRAAALLRETARSHASKVGSLSEGALDVVAVVLDDGTVAEMPPATSRRLGLREGDASLADACHPHDVWQLQALLAAAVRGGARRAEGGLRLRVDGVARHFNVRVTDLRDDPDVGGLAVNAHDVDALHRLATVDVLTSLPNRATLGARLERALVEGRAGAVLLVDLDGFKEVNDTFGHAAGDAVLATSARRMEAALGVDGERWMARLGGDEFVAVLPDPDPAEAMRVAGRIIAAMREPVDVQGLSFALGASVGVRTVEPGDAAEEALRDADIALYEAKRQGRGRPVRFESPMADALREKVALRAALEEGLARGELSLVYQPKVRCADGALVGVEALARWRRPDGRQIAPARFIPVAEESGQIVELGHLVLDHAVAQLARWDDLAGPSPLRMAVNVSPRQLHDPRFVERVADVLRARGIAPARLVLELTETAVMTDPERSARLLARVRALGVHVSIDDYGAGNASISYLRQIPAEEVKIDRSLTEGLRTRDRSATALVRSIIDMARALHLTVVAEGVEDEDQLSALRALGCDLAQGYAVAPPLEADAATRFVRDHLRARRSLAPQGGHDPERVSIH